MDAINCFHVFWTQLKVKHLEGRNNHINLSRKEPASSRAMEDFPAGWRQEESGRRVCPQLPGEQPGTLCWVLTSPSHTSFSVHLTNITVHQSLIFLSESLVTENKLKIFFFQTHCLWTLLTQYKIRLIILFAAKDGEVLYSQQKQDRELTVAQIMNSLLPNSDLNWRK